jgi:AAA domain
MAGLRAAWEKEHGPGSVIGLAPSAAAAEVLGDELGTDTENTAKWLTEWRRIRELMAQRERLARRLGRHPHPLSPGVGTLRRAVEELDQVIESRRLHRGQLVIVDEASLSGTFALDELVSAAKNADARVLLVGDWAQLSAVDAGGAFHLLVRDRADLVPEQSEVRRFQHEWERVASVELRLGNRGVIDTYQAQGRVAGGERTEMLDRLYQAWKNDIHSGKSSLMIAGDAETVRELNHRAQADRVAAGQVLAAGLSVANGQTAGVGDLVVTLENNRLVATGKRWVKNGDRWTVTATDQDGSMTARRANGTGEVVLPADYVAQHVELAYATTAHRAQGRTVDTAHAMVSPTTTREVLYVSATRGREANQLYVDTHYDPDPATGHDGTTQPQTARDILAAVLAREGADLSAHETLRRAQHQADDFTALANEYLTLAREAQQQRWDDLLDCCELSEADLEAVRCSDAYGPLMAALRDAEARGLDVEATFPKLAAARALDDAEDPAAVLHGRVDRWVTAAGSRRQAAFNLIAGLIPRATGISDPDMSRALAERDQAMEDRARQLAEHAIEHRHVWVQRLGNPPVNSASRELWLRAVCTVAAYRERWGIGNHHRPLGPETAVKTIEGLGHSNRAQTAVEVALRLSGGTRTAPQEAPAPVPDRAAERGIEL